ncbi:MAG: baseplate J/gp47 family protein [Oscillospiraceae bacterium]
MSRFYHELYNIYNLGFVETSVGEYLDKVTEQFGVYRKKATKSLRCAKFYDYDNNLMDVELGTRFFANDIFYKVIEKISIGNFEIQCEQDGIIGNKFFGQLSTTQYIKFLNKVYLEDIILYGSDEESDESLKNRFKTYVNTPSFSGNIADYKNFVLNIDGVSAVRVEPCFNGGGTVRIVVLDNNFSVPSKDLVLKVQNKVDPLDKEGKGDGLAPIGHRVLVEGAENFVINIKTKITYKKGWSFNNLEPYIKSLIDDYFLEINSNFTYEDNLVFRISHIESRLLSMEGIIDVFDTRLNGLNKNIVLQKNLIALRGDFVDSEI